MGTTVWHKTKLTVFGTSHQELPHHPHAIRIHERPHRQCGVARPRAIHGLVVWTVAAACHAEVCLNPVSWPAQMALTIIDRQCSVDKRALYGQDGCICLRHQCYKPQSGLPLYS